MSTLVIGIQVTQSGRDFAFHKNCRHTHTHTEDGGIRKVMVSTSSLGEADFIGLFIN